MKKLVVLILVGLLSITLFSQHALAVDDTEDTSWVLIVTNEADEQFFIMRESPRLGIIDTVPVIGVVGKVKNASGNESNMTWFIPVEACNAKQGIFVATSLQGKLLFRMEFNLSDETSLSVVAAVMCSVAVKQTEEKSKPALPSKPSNNTPYINIWHKEHRTGVIVV